MKNDKYSSSRTLESFSAKILKGDEDKHSELIKEAIDDENIYNIALSGAYGSGKTSVIKTFKNKYRLEYVDISLATFDDKLIDEKNISKLEYCILKQLFYKVSPDKVPQSRFKRIKNHEDTIKSVILLFFWLISIFYFLENKFLNDINKSLGIYTYCAPLNFIYGIYALFGCFYFVQKLYDFVLNFKMTKLKFNDAEVENNNDKATLNFENEIDEILYFFERNPIDVVFIEDLDRFNNTEIFIKLREINFLINNYEPINQKRKITFIYAVIDDIFSQNERTKFFDIILPVVPIINYTNSTKELLDRFDEEINSIENDKERKKFKKFIEKVSLYLTDMRVIISITNEYKIYKKILNENVDRKKLLAMMVYKNAEPTDFDSLNTQKGYLYSLLNNKKELIKQQINSLTIKNQSEEKNIENYRIEVEKEVIESSKQLRMLYINSLLGLFYRQHGQFLTHLTLDSQRISYLDLLDEKKFNLLKTANITECYYDNRSFATRTSFTFNDIEKNVNSIFKYDERIEIIKFKNQNKIEKSNKIIEENNTKIKYLNSKSLAQLINENIVTDYFTARETIYLESIKGNKKIKPVTNFKLINFLVKNAFINEDYEHYMSRQDGNLSKEDRDFLLSFDSNPLPFETQLKEFDTIIDRIDESYYYKEAILNFSLISYLLDNKMNSELNKITSVFKDEPQNYLEFIDEYLKVAKDYQKNKFFEIALNSWDTFFIDIDKKSHESKLEYLKLIFTNLSLQKIKTLNKHNKCISIFMQNLSDLTPIFFETTNNKSKVEQYIKDESIYFENLEFNQEHISLLKFIYENNRYEINEKMIELMINSFKDNDVEIEINKLKTANYTAIQESGCDKLIAYIDDEIEHYLENVLLELSDNTEESEENIIILLDELGVSNEYQVKLIEKNKTIIQDITKIEDKNLWKELFKYNRLEIKWENIVEYFIEFKEIDSTLITYLNQQEVSETLSKQEIKITDSVIKTDFCLKLINSKIKLESFNFIVKSIDIEYNYDEVCTIGNEKIKTLLENYLIEFSVENFDAINIDNNDLAFLFSELNKDEFIENLTEFTLVSKNIKDILKPNAFTDSEKATIITNIDEALINSDEELKINICAFLLKINTINIKESLLLSILGSTADKLKRVSIFNKYYKSDIQLEILKIRLEKLGMPYINISNSYENIYLEDNNENRTFYSLLQNRLLGKNKLLADGRILIWQKHEKK